MAEEKILKDEQLDEEQLEEVAGGDALPIIQPNQQGYYPPQGNWNQPPQGNWNQPPQQINYPPGYRPNPVPNPNPGSWNQQPQGGYQQQPNLNVPPTQK